MFAACTLALIFPLLGSNVRADVAASAQSTTRAGLIPLDSLGRAEPGADEALTVSVGGRLLSERTSFQLVYTPRLFFQIPGTLELGRPLILQQLGAHYQTALSRRTNFGLDLSGSAGEVSYSYFNQDLEPGTGTARASTVPIFVTSGNLLLDHQTSERNTVNALLSAGYQTQPEVLFGNTDESSLPTSLNTSLSLSDYYALTARDRLGLILRSSYIGTEDPTGDGVDTPDDVMTFGGGLSWRRRWSERAELGLDGGAELSYDVESDSLAFIPTAVVTHSTNWRGLEQDWQSRSSFGVRGFFDQASATYRPQGFASSDLVATFNPSWSSGVNLFGSTSLAPDPIVPEQFESLIALEAPTSYRIAQSATLSFGARASLRAPHLGQEDGLSPQGEFTGFIDLRYTLGTDREQGAWLRQ